MRARLRLCGWLPERALSRLHRAGIALYEVKRTAKDEIVFSVDEKDVEKTLALYPKTEGYASFWAERLPARGLRALLNAVKPRAGLALGLALFLAATLFADGRVLAVRIDGDTPYEKEIAEILEEGGVRALSRFPEENADLITSRILSLDGVAFSSVKKVGATLVVEVRHGSFAPDVEGQSALIASADGVVEAVFALRGVTTVTVGQQVRAGDTLAVAETVSFDSVWELRCKARWDDFILFGTEFQKKVFGRTFIFTNPADCEEYWKIEDHAVKCADVVEKATRTIAEFLLDNE